MAPLLSSTFGVALATMQPGFQQKRQQQRAQQQAPLGGLAAAVNAAINTPATGKVVAAAASEPGKIKMYSPEYYYTCGVGGVLSCGLTHTAVTPLDVVKARLQQPAPENIRKKM